MDSMDAKAADVNVDITQASPLVVASQSTWRKTLRAWWRVAWTTFSYTPLAFLLGRLIHILAPTPTERSAYNNLHFAFAPDGSPLRLDGRYPVKITAGVLPKRFHAHNDYQHEVPLLKALSYGAASIEADIWLVDGELYVGHDAEDLRPDRTLRSLYLNPLKAILDAANEGNTGKMKGIWETTPELPLHLLIDIKTDGPTTFAALYEALAPLRSAQYLSAWTSTPPGQNYSSGQPRTGVPQDNGVLSPSVITIIGTGNTELFSVAALGYDPSTPRDIFLDAVLDLLPLSPNSSAVAYSEAITPSIAPLASVDLRRAVGWRAWTIPALARPRVRELVNIAHARGIQARFWRTPGMPIATRNAIWQMLLDEGVDWLNVDDLPAAAAF